MAAFPEEDSSPYLHARDAKLARACFDRRSFRETVQSWELIEDYWEAHRQRIPIEPTVIGTPPDAPSETPLPVLLCLGDEETS
jgi:hypothetical protein